MAEQKIPQFFVQAMDSPLPAPKFYELAHQVAQTHYVNDAEFQRLAIKGMDSAIHSMLANSSLDDRQDARARELASAFGLTMEDLGEIGRKLTKAEILRDLENGRLPQRVQLAGTSPLNLEKNESIIWIFNGTTCFSYKKRTQYVGVSHGVSVRIMKGVYYRVGAFKGEPVQTQYLVNDGVGDLVITNKAVYFLSSTTTLKWPAKKIVAVQQFSDGIQVSRDGVSSKQQSFTLDDPWFAANLIVRLNQL